MSKWQVCAILSSMVIERLFVTADDLAGTLDPSGRGPATAVRRLRETHLISHGIEVRPHRAGRLRGAVVYYCALNLDAVEALRDGNESMARKLAKAAGEIEAKPTARHLVSVLTGDIALSALELGERRAASNLATAIRRIRDRLAHAPSPLLGWVVATEDDYVTVDADDTTIVLPRETLRTRGLDRPGVPVAIRSHQLRTGAMIHSVDRALAFDEDDRGSARRYDPFEMRRERRRAGPRASIRELLAGRTPVRLVAPLAVAR